MAKIGFFHHGYAWIMCNGFMHLAVAQVPVLPWVLQEVKFAALVVLGVATAVAGSGYNGANREGP